MIRILIADDHRLVAEGLKLMLSNQENMQCTGLVENGRQVLSFLETNAVDVILMDIEMPLMDGLECAKAVKKRWPAIAILALSSYDKASFIEQMLRNGASGYLLKNTQQDELSEAIKTVYSGQKYLGKKAQRTLLDGMSAAAPASQIPVLTRREKEVLRLIAQEFTTAEIGDQLTISVNTVESHRRNLLSKFGVRNSVGLIKAAMKFELI